MFCANPGGNVSWAGTDGKCCNKNDTAITVVITGIAPGGGN